MKFSANTYNLKEALESIQVRGKYLNDRMLSSSSLGEAFYMFLEGNVLSLWNGDVTFIVNITVEVEGETNGSYIGSAKTIIPYLKNFGETVTVEVGDFLTITSGNRKASVPMIVNHRGMDAISRVKDMTKHMTYGELTLPKFSNKEFEGAFSLTEVDFTRCLNLSELVKSGVYELNFKDNSVVISTQLNAENKYEETITPSAFLGEGATVDFSGPLHKFFKKGQLINFYVKDEFPLVLVADDRKLIKAPYVAGN